jgi:DNA-binding PadR family transcriptional regulator
MFHKRRFGRQEFAWEGAHDGPPFGWMIWQMARRFPFGHGRHGRGSGEGSFFGRGDLKYGLLELLLERPKHGYEMIKELENKAGGFYTPSAGAVYPALQLMEDREWITSQTVEGKKVYTITDAGKKALEEHKQNAENFGPPRGFGRKGKGGPFGHEARPELHALRHEGMEVARLMLSAVMASEGDPKKLTQIRKIVENTKRELQKFLNNESTSPGDDIL